MQNSFYILKFLIFQSLFHKLLNQITKLPSQITKPILGMFVLHYMVIPNIVMKFQNVDFFLEIFEILDPLSAHIHRMVKCFKELSCLIMKHLMK